MTLTPLYVATINTPGYLPMADDLTTFNNAPDAWAYLAEERQRGEEQGDPDGEDWSDTVATLAMLGERSHWASPIGPRDGWDSAAEQTAWLAEKGIAADGTGTVYGGTPGYQGDHDLGIAYSVSVIAHANYPHNAGRLYDCPACDAACHCVADETECVFEGEHNGMGEPEDCEHNA